MQHHGLVGLGKQLVDRLKIVHHEISTLICVPTEVVFPIRAECGDRRNAGTDGTFPIFQGLVRNWGQSRLSPVYSRVLVLFKCGILRRKHLIQQTPMVLEGSNAEWK